MPVGQIWMARVGSSGKPLLDLPDFAAVILVHLPAIVARSQTYYSYLSQ